MAADVLALAAAADIANPGCHADAVFAGADGQAAVVAAMLLSCLAMSGYLAVALACTLHLRTTQHELPKPFNTRVRFPASRIPSCRVVSTQNWVYLLYKKRLSRLANLLMVILALGPKNRAWRSLSSQEGCQPAPTSHAVST